MTAQINVDQANQILTRLTQIPGVSHHFQLGCLATFFEVFKEDNPEFLQELVDGMIMIQNNILTYQTQDVNVMSKQLQEAANVPQEMIDISLAKLKQLYAQAGQGNSNQSGQS